MPAECTSQGRSLAPASPEGARAPPLISSVGRAPPLPPARATVLGAEWAAWSYFGAALELLWGPIHLQSSASAKSAADERAPICSLGAATPKLSWAGASQAAQDSCRDA